MLIFWLTLKSVIRRESHNGLPLPYVRSPETPFSILHTVAIHVLIRREAMLIGPPALHLVGFALV
jgi:hypothetical protein